MVRINLAPEDIEANKQGRLSEQQARDLRKQRLVWLLGMIGFFVLGLGTTAVLLLKIFNPAFANRGQLFIVVPLLLFWLWLLRSTPRRWYQANLDLRAAQIAVVEGELLPNFDLGIGLLKTIKYRICADGFA